jgi:membrane-bound serine protease (ClpP class)
MRIIICLITCLLLTATLLAAERPIVRAVRIHDPITPVTAHFLHRNLIEAAQRGDRLLLVEMDTPGGLDPAMRDMVQDIFAAPLPVVVYVAPAGARAASAGAIIALAADICAMAPGTNIGAAHPVTLGEKPDKVMEAKVLNDAEAYAEGIARKRGRNETLARQMVRDSISLSADKALAGNVIDLVAEDRPTLLRQLDGRRISRNGRELILHLAGAQVVPAEMGGVERILNSISNPNVAYALLILGVLGIFFELSTPGVILPGVVGGISLVLAFFALQMLPVNYAGVLLILLALMLFIAEIKITSHGMLTVGGVVALVFGSLLLFESPEPYLRVSRSVIFTTALAVAGFFAFAAIKGLSAQRRRPTTGQAALIGQPGRAIAAIDPEGKVFVRGEYWDAWSDEPIAAGAQVVVAAVEGMRLKVKKG